MPKQQTEIVFPSPPSRRSSEPPGPKPLIMCSFNPTQVAECGSYGEVTGVFSAYVQFRNERVYTGPPARDEELAVIGLLSHLGRNSKSSEWDNYAYHAPENVPPDRKIKWTTLEQHK